MVAEDERAAEHLSRLGIRALPMASATEALTRILGWNPVQVALMEVDWARWGQIHAKAKVRPRFSHVLAESVGAGQDRGTGDLRATLIAMGLEERVERLASCMAELVAETLRRPTDKVDVYQPLTEMGIDSLIGMELQTAVSVQLGIEISILELMKGDNIVGVARKLLEKMNIPVIVASPDETTVATVLDEFSAQSMG
jgi:acyl carrier protein